MSSDAKAINKSVHNPIRIDPETCVKCNLCDWICPGDLIYKEEDNRETLPVIAYPDECWYCGHCQSICPVEANTVIITDQMINCQTDVKTLLGKVIE
ncbi:MAG: ferredoxin family protein [Gammaproteobacteria bacterium]|nr:ferredoxin family protein [Gammaproteobacteria bacterium]